MARHHFTALSPREPSSHTSRSERSMKHTSSKHFIWPAQTAHHSPIHSHTRNSTLASTGVQQHLEERFFAWKVVILYERRESLASRLLQDRTGRYAGSSMMWYAALETDEHVWSERLICLQRQRIKGGRMGGKACNYGLCDDKAPRSAKPNPF